MDRLNYMIDYQEASLFNRAQGAIIAAAYGDALGWPNERLHRNHSESFHTNRRLSELKKWTRHSGGRYYPHDQIIEAGTYSDDTQLILSNSRALLHGVQWLEWFCHIELPFWALYEKGGGGATKRAAEAWKDGISPWSKQRSENDVKKYFDAGGNGVAMRILPHILYNADLDTYAPIAQNILLDGIATHGHPRALVGALCYGYGLWKSIRRTEQLKFGELIDNLLSSSVEWGTLPEPNPISSEWLKIANQHVPDYHDLWMRTVDELTSYLEICKTGISRVPLTLDDGILRSINCFDRNVSGAGTVATAAAVYLASRYAPDPMNGVIKAAYAIGTDTDTIASMTGGLLGIINGIEWIHFDKSSIQDSEYLQEMAEAIVKKNRVSEPCDIPRFGTRSQLKKFRNHLFETNTGQSLELPDERHGEIVSVNETIGKTSKFKVLYYRIKTDDGQSIEVSKIARGYFADRHPTKNIENPSPVVTPLNLGIKIPTHKLSEAKWFYKDLLGLEIMKETKEIVVFDQGLSLVPSAHYSTSKYGGSDVRTWVYFEVADLETLFHRLKDDGIHILTSPSQWGNSKRNFFACNDPDGNIIEVFSLNKSSTMKTIAVS
ncbi:MAG: ADP-ribosylglycohydrolase family protein [Bacteroidetes bacterium]|nr:ADP-ribosylglycohydrolase family protein [Bacteroidota bacterium]